MAHVARWSQSLQDYTRGGIRKTEQLFGPAKTSSKNCANSRFSTVPKGARNIPKGFDDPE